MDWLIGHLIGDFLLQNDYLAQGKKRSHAVCLTHVLIYTCSVLVCTGWCLYVKQAPAIALAIGVPHFLIDRWKFVAWSMKASGQWDGFGQPPLAPWSLIVVDQVWHLLCLWILSRLLPWLIP